MVTPTSISKPNNDDQKADLIYNIRLSSVGPGRHSGTDVAHEPASMDLAMKLHYLRAVYFFGKEAAEGLTTMAIKEAMFVLFNDYYHTCGRFRRTEAGRPYIKCNDCGARFVEACCDKTVEEWLEMEDRSLDKLLVYHKPIGPEIQFSPPIFLQLTRFKDGGMSMGLSWAHVLGDPFSASDFINMWGRVMAGLKPNSPAHIIQPHGEIEKCQNPPKVSANRKEPLSIKRVDPVGDLWVPANDLKMETLSFYMSASQLTHLQAQVSSGLDRIPAFEALCATIWQCVAKIKGEDEPKIVTICKNDPHTRKVGVASNSQIINKVKVDFPIADANPKELAMLMVDQAVDERSLIEEEVERDNGVSDFMLYGANLTFLDLGETELYDLELGGHKPVFVNYIIQGVGDKGAVLVLRGPDENDKARIVTITLPENEMLEVKGELKKNGLLLERNLG